MFVRDPTILHGFLQSNTEIAFQHWSSEFKIFSLNGDANVQFAMLTSLYSGRWDDDPLRYRRVYALVDLSTSRMTVQQNTSLSFIIFIYCQVDSCLN